MGLVLAAVAVVIGLVTLRLHQSDDPLGVRLLLLGLAVGPWLPPDRVGFPLTTRAALAAIPAALLYVRGDQFAAMLIVLAATLVIARGRYALAVATLGAGVAMVVVGAVLHRGVAEAFLAGALGLGIVSGWSVRAERRLVEDLRAARVELDRAALVEERRRIARDVHDLVAHSLTVVMLNLTAARLEVRRDPEAASATLAETERLGRQAMAEVRGLVGLLRQNEAADPAAPLPQAADLRRLVDRLHEAGMAVELTVEGELDRLTPAAGLALYRIGQEALSNAARHATGARVRVRLDVGTGEARLSVRDWGLPAAERRSPGGSGGHGLVGMRERAALVGGSLRAGWARPGWEVECVVPI
jgi:signal transduction histidine kinase